MIAAGSVAIRRRQTPVRLAALTLITLVAFGLPVTSGPSARPPRHEGLAVAFRAIGTAVVRTPAWLTKATASPFEFRMVGVAWPRAQRAQGTPNLRTSRDGIGWTPWSVIELQDNGPDRGSAEDKGIVATEPIWVGPARFAQLRWSGAEPPAGIRLHVIDPGGDPRTPSASLAAAPAQPSVVSRAQWGADESIRRCCPTFAPSVDFAVVHHTATTNAYPREESAAIVRSIYEYHVRVNGWADVGYHFLIDRYGRVFEGRAGGIRQSVIGAHAEGFNTRSTGVSLIGSFQGEPPTGASLDALRKLLAWKLDVHHVDPRGSTTAVSGGSRKYPAGRSVRVNAIAAHRDLQETACPGRVADMLQQIRLDVFGIGLPKIFRPLVSPPVFTPNGDGSGDSLRTTASVSDGATWRVRLLSEGGTELKTWTGSGNINVSWDGRIPTGAAPHGYYKVDISATKQDVSATPTRVTAALYRDPWGAWTRVGGVLDAAGAPRLTTGPNGTFHLLGRDGSGGVRYAEWANGAWGAVRRLGTSGEIADTQGRLGFTTDPNGVRHALIRGRNSNIYHGRILTNGTFTGWARVGGATDRGTDLALAADRSGTVHALVVGMGGNLFANRYSGGWSGWKRVGASQDKGKSPVLTSGNEGDVLAVVVSASSGIYANKFDPSRGWRSRWSSVGRSLGYGREPTVAAVDEGFIVILRGQSAPNIWQSSGTIGMWSGWTRVGSASDSGFEPAAVTTHDDVVLAVRGRTSGRIYANVRAPDGAWRGWDEAGDSLQEGVLPTLATTGGRVMLATEVPGGPPAAIVAVPPLRSR